MTSQSSITVPHWLLVAFAAAIVSSVSCLVMGMIVTTVGTIADGCGRFDEFGCEGYLVMSVYALPIGALSGGLLGGISTVVMRERQENSDKR